MGAGGGIWEAADTITAARMNQKTVYVGDDAPATTYEGMLWYETDTNILKVRDEAGGVWLALTNQSGTSTTVGGSKEITFGTAFPSTPRVFCMVNDGTDANLVLTSVAADKFTVKARILATATFVNSVNLLTGGGSLHSHSITTGSATAVTGVTSPTGSESSHTHPSPSTTTQLGVALTGLFDGYCAVESGGPTNTLFDAPVANGISMVSFVKTLDANTGAGSSHSHTVSSTTASFINSVTSPTGNESAHTHVITRTSANALTGWIDGDAVGFNWLAIPQ